MIDGMSDFAVGLLGLYVAVSLLVFWSFALLPSPRARLTWNWVVLLLVFFPAFVMALVTTLFVALWRVLDRPVWREDD